MILRPGHVTLAEWRAIYQGARPSLDPSCHAGIAASAAAVEAILARHEPVYGINTGFGKLASVRIGDEDLETLQRNIVLSHAAGVGDPVPVPIVRLMIALKLTSLAQGASGVRPATIEMLQHMLQHDVMPVIPGQGSVGASGDLAPLSHMAAAMIGVGDVMVGGERRAAKDVLTPLTLGPKEGLALLNGTQFSCAHALAGLFEAERLFRAALVTGALSTEAAKGSDTPFDHRIHVLRGHRGQIEVADTLRRLMAGSAIRASHAVDDERVQDPYCLRCQPQVMGACLDLLRQAGATLAVEANGVTDNPLIFAGANDQEGGEALSGGNFHAEPVAFAADMIALAVCEIGSLSERRIAMLVDPALSGLPAFLTPHPGLNSGFMIPQVTAAALVSENKQRAYPASVDSIPTSANQEDHVSMAAHGSRRLLAMTANLGHVIGIEYLAAAQGCDFHQPLRSSDELERARAILRAKVPTLGEDRHFAPDMAVATELLAELDFELPGVEA